MDVLAVSHGLHDYDSDLLAAARVVHETLDPGVDLHFGAEDAHLNEVALPQDPSGAGALAYGLRRGVDRLHP